MAGNNYPRNFKTVRYWRHDNGKLTLGTHIWWPVEPVTFETVEYGI